MKKHLAIFTPDAVKEIFAGRKTIESRFSQKKIAPFSEVSVGDLVYIKPTGGDIAGQFSVKKVIFFEGLEEEDLKKLFSIYQENFSFDESSLDQLYFKSKIKAQFGTLIFIGQLEQFITSPLKIEKKDHRGWVVLD